MTHKSICISAQSALNQGVKRNPKRKSVASNKELTKRLDELERTYEMVIDAIQQLMRPPVRKRRPIGFRATIPKKSRDSSGKRCKL